MNNMTEVGTAFIYSGHSENMASGQSSPGIFVFSRSLQLQYVNHRALELIRNISHAITESGLIVLSRPLLELRDQIQESLDDRLEANIWEPFEMSRVVSESGRRLLFSDRHRSGRDRVRRDGQESTGAFPDEGTRDANNERRVPCEFIKAGGEHRLIVL